MDRTVSIHAYEGKVDICRSSAGKLYLCLFRSVLKPLLSHTVISQINAVRLLEFICNIIHKSLIEVITAETVIACGCQHFKYSIANFQNGYIECTAAKVVNEDLLVSFFIHTVSKSCCRRFVDDTQYIETCNLTCILGCLTLAVAEICGDGDNRIAYRFTEICRLLCGGNRCPFHV